VRRYSKRIGIDHLAPHDLRRTCARLCHEAGGELAQIQFLLGHAAKDRPSSELFGWTVAFLLGAILILARANCDPTTQHGSVAHPSGFCMPFNAHRPGIFGRFSPIRF
jgi:hypothetical protein